VTADIHGFPVEGVMYSVYGGDQEEGLVSPENLIASVSDTSYQVTGAILQWPLRFFVVVSELP
jgi:hypothetical protein